MNRISISILALGIVVFSACRSTQTINKAIEPKELAPVMAHNDADDSIKMVKESFDLFKSGKIDFKTFNAKIKVDSYGSKGKNPDITAVVRIVKDSAIWVSLSATILNVEVYRLFITKDSVILINKQDKEVQYRSLDYLQGVTEIPFDFNTLQDLIIGNPVFLGDSVISYRKVNNNILIATIDSYFKNLITLSNDNKTMLHSKMDDIDVARSRTADIIYNSYENTTGQLFSTYRYITVSEKNKMDVELNFKQYEFNKELSVAFPVPKNYKRK